MMKTLNLDEAQKYCIFECDENLFGFPSLATRSVIPRPVITPLPHSDPVVVGIGHVQNEFVPVIRLRSLLDGKYEANDAEQQLMVMNGPQSAWGVLIDRAIGLTPLETSVSTLTDRIDIWSKVVVGSASYGNRVIQVLEPETIFSYTLKLLERFWFDANRLADESS